MNLHLLKPVEADEVKDAIFSMMPDKAPGSDGMSRFYQSFWSIVGRDLTDFISECINTGYIPPGLNDTNVVLIPKRKS